VPKLLVTDNAPEFVARELNDWCSSNGIQKVESPTYHPQSNGVAERGVQTVKHCMAAWNPEATHLSFTEYLKRVLLHHRACFRRRDGRTPAEVVFGRQIRLPLARQFAFGEKVILKSGSLPSQQVMFMLPRGSNTALILNEAAGRVQLAHSNQWGPTAATTLPLPTMDGEQDPPDVVRPPNQEPLEAEATPASPAPPPLTTRPTLNRKVKVPANFKYP
jgi:hypothetical protein